MPATTELTTEQKERQAKKRRRTRRIYNVAIVIVSLFLVYQVYDIAIYYRDLNKNSEISETAHDIFVEAVGEPEAVTETELSSAESEEEAEIVPNAGILALQEEFANEDIFAYISIPDTNISYPIVQGEDNEYYLKHDLYGNSSATGSIFIDYNNATDFSDRNSVFYGHNMRNGSMFHNLRYYRDEEYYNEHPYITITTLYETTTWVIFAAYDTTVDFDYIRTDFDSDEDFMELVNTFIANTSYDTGVEVTADDVIITLSTCSNITSSSRFAVHAKLVSSVPSTAATQATTD